MIQNGFLSIPSGFASPAIGLVPVLLLLHQPGARSPSAPAGMRATLLGWNEGNAAARPDLQAEVGQTDGRVFPREMPRIQRACE